MKRFFLAVVFLCACGGDDAAPAELAGLGEPCTHTRECEPELYCDDSRRCAASGLGGDGAACATTADCLMGYTCVREPDGWVCRMNGDRDIGDPCLRHEQCLAGLYCVRGACAASELDAGPSGFDGGSSQCMTSSECNDGSACTTDMCIADTCIHTLIDSDEDGYASTIIGSCGLDCADMDPNANPDQEAFSDVRHAGGPGQPPTFDWNCDGTEEPEHANAITCSIEACDSGEGWLDPLPECGQPGRWGRCTTGCTEEVLEPARVQRCR